MIDYKNKYLELCQNINLGFSKEDVRKHNNAMEKLEKLLSVVREKEDNSFLLELLENDDIKVRSLVASHCLRLGIYTKKAKKILKEVSKNKYASILAFNAKTTLELWKKGELK